MHFVEIYPSVFSSCCNSINMEPMKVNTKFPFDNYPATHAACVRCEPRPQRGQSGYNVTPHSANDPFTVSPHVPRVQVILMVADLSGHNKQPQASHVRPISVNTPIEVT